MNSIRHLMTSLNRAFEDRRIYVVHDIEMELKTDTLDELLRAETMALIMGNEAEGEAAEVVGGLQPAAPLAPSRVGRGGPHRERIPGRPGKSCRKKNRPNLNVSGKLNLKERNLFMREKITVKSFSAAMLFRSWPSSRSIMWFM